MKNSLRNLFGLFLIIVSISSNAVQFPANIKKSDINSYMRKYSNFKKSDYPYYEEPNACGTREGLGYDPYIRDKWMGVSFVTACNNHDRCFMTIGAKRENCQYRFRSDIVSACNKKFKLYDPRLITCRALAYTYAGATTFTGSLLTAWTSSQSKAHDYERALATEKPNILLFASGLRRVDEKIPFYDAALVNRIRNLNMVKIGGIVINNNYVGDVKIALYHSDNPSKVFASWLFKAKEKANLVYDSKRITIGSDWGIKIIFGNGVESPVKPVQAVLSSFNLGIMTVDASNIYNKDSWTVWR
jgi:hypothetical protein